MTIDIMKTMSQKIFAFSREVPGIGITRSEAEKMQALIALAKKHLDPSGLGVFDIAEVLSAIEQALADVR